MRISILLATLICSFSLPANAGGNGLTALLGGVMKGASEAQEQKDMNDAYQRCLGKYSEQACSIAKAEIERDRQMKEQQAKIEQLERDVEEAKARASAAQWEAQEARQPVITR